MQVTVTRFPGYTGQVPASLALQVTVPAGARFALLVFHPEIGGSAWSKALRILVPSKESAGARTANGTERAVEFWVPAVSAGDELQARLLLLVSLDGRIVAAMPLATQSRP